MTYGTDTNSFSSGRVNFTDSLVGEMRREINYEHIYRLLLHNKIVISGHQKVVSTYANTSLVIQEEK